MKSRLTYPFLILASVFMFDLYAFAAELEATKTATPVDDITKNMHAQVELRHYAAFKMTDDKVDSVSPMAQTRLYLNTKLLDDKLWTQFTFGAIKKPETTKITQRRTWWENYYTAFTNDHGEITPHATLYLPNEGSGTNADIGSYQEARAKMETAVGSFLFAGAGDFWTSVASREEKVKPEIREKDQNGTAFGLSGNNNDEMTKRDPSYTTEYSTVVKFVPSMAKKWSLMSIVYFDTMYDPKYEAFMQDGDAKTELVGYQVRHRTLNRVLLTYQASKRTSFTNDFIQHCGGFFAGSNDPVDGPTRYENVVRVNYDLF